MTKFTPEEISLCKQVAEKYRKKTTLGDWLCRVDDNALHFVSFEDAPWYQKSKDYIPLWTIFDCLEFLGKKGLLDDWSIDKEWDEDANQTGNICFWWKPTPKGRDRYTLGKTVLEACLKAVLAVLEDKK